MSEGSAPSPAAYNPNIQGGGMSIGNNPGAQMWLCGFIAVLDGRRYLNPLAEFMQITADKMIMPVQAINPIPMAGLGLGNLGIIRELLDILKQGGGLVDSAGDIQDAYAALQAAGVNMDGLGESDMKAILGNLSVQNANMAAMMNAGGAELS